MAADKRVPELSKAATSGGQLPLMALEMNSLNAQNYKRTRRRGRRRSGRQTKQLCKDEQEAMQKQNKIIAPQVPSSKNFNWFKLLLITYFTCLNCFHLSIPLLNGATVASQPLDSLKSRVELVVVVASQNQSSLFASQLPPADVHQVAASLLTPPTTAFDSVSLISSSSSISANSVQRPRQRPRPRRSQSRELNEAQAISKQTTGDDDDDLNLSSSSSSSNDYEPDGADFESNGQPPEAPIPTTTFNGDGGGSSLGNQFDSSPTSTRLAQPTATSNHSGNESSQVMRTTTTTVEIEKLNGSTTTASEQHEQRLLDGFFSHIDKQWKFAEIILIIVISAILNLVTIVGNIMVLISFKMDRSLQTVSNYFLLSLALADLLIGLISMPLYTLYLLLNYWPLGPLMCDIWLAIDYLNSNAAVLNMLIISFDRYFSVTRPLTYRAKRTTKHACLMISFAWILSLTIWTPAIFTYPYYKGRTVQGTDKCEIEFVKANTYLTFVTAILAFYIPVAIMIYLYWRIWLETKKRYRDLTTLFLVSGVGAAAPSRPAKPPIISTITGAAGQLKSAATGAGAAQRALLAPPSRHSTKAPLLLQAPALNEQPQQQQPQPIKLKSSLKTSRSPDKVANTTTAPNNLAHGGQVELRKQETNKLEVNNNQNQKSVIPTEVEVEKLEGPSKLLQNNVPVDQQQQQQQLKQSAEKLADKSMQSARQQTFATSNNNNTATFKGESEPKWASRSLARGCKCSRCQRAGQLAGTGSLANSSCRKATRKTMLLQPDNCKQCRDYLEKYHPELPSGSNNNNKQVKMTNVAAAAGTKSSLPAAAISSSSSSKSQCYACCCCPYPAAAAEAAPAGSGANAGQCAKCCSTAAAAANKQQARTHSKQLATSAKQLNLEEQLEQARACSSCQADDEFVKRPEGGSCLACDSSKKSQSHSNVATKTRKENETKSQEELNQLVSSSSKSIYQLISEAGSAQRAKIHPKLSFSEQQVNNSQRSTSTTNAIAHDNSIRSSEPPQVSTTTTTTANDGEKLLVDVATSPINFSRLNLEFSLDSNESFQNKLALIGGNNNNGSSSPVDSYEQEDFETRILSQGNRFKFESNDPKLIACSAANRAAHQQSRTSTNLPNNKLTKHYNYKHNNHHHHHHHQTSSCCCAAVISAHDAECKFCRPITKPEQHFTLNSSISLPKQHGHHHHHHHHHHHAANQNATRAQAAPAACHSSGASGGHSRNHNHHPAHHPHHHHHSQHSHHSHHHHHHSHAHRHHHNHHHHAHHHAQHKSQLVPMNLLAKNLSPKLADCKKCRATNSTRDREATLVNKTDELPAAAAAGNSLPILGALKQEEAHAQSEQQQQQQQQSGELASKQVNYKKFSQKLTFSDNLVDGPQVKQQQQQLDRPTLQTGYSIPMSSSVSIDAETVRHNSHRLRQLYDSGSSIEHDDGNGNSSSQNTTNRSFRGAADPRGWLARGTSSLLDSLASVPLIETLVPSWRRSRNRPVRYAHEQISYDEESDAPRRVASGANGGAGGGGGRPSRSRKLIKSICCRSSSQKAGSNRHLVKRFSSNESSSAHDKQSTQLPRERSPPTTEDSSSDQQVDQRSRQLQPIQQHQQQQQRNFQHNSSSKSSSSGTSGQASQQSHQHNNSSNSNNNNYHHHHPIQPKSERKAAKTLSTLLLVFIVTWLPYNVLVLIKTLSGGEDMVPEKVWNFSYYLCYINSTINPLCYALCNAQFRRTYMRILQCKLSNDAAHCSTRRMVPIQTSSTWNKDARLNSTSAGLDCNLTSNTQNNSSSPMNQTNRHSDPNRRQFRQSSRDNGTQRH